MRYPTAVPSKEKSDRVDELPDLSSEFVQLARLALAGSDHDAAVYVQRAARRLRKTRPEIANELVSMLREGPTRASPLRRIATPLALPVDVESKLPLLRVEHYDADIAPILPERIRDELDLLIAERSRRDELLRAGLSPTRTALFVGPPGVGKTLVARWVAERLGRPLLVLDLTAVMSSLLGRTGSNLRQVLDYAKADGSVLLLDELDAIAKRRNDAADVGELKRLVTVLLQQIDDWPASGGLLIAATNHPELLDPAVWRRFELVVEFPLPDEGSRRTAISRFAADAIPQDLVDALAFAFEDRSYSDIERDLRRARRAVAMGHNSIASEVEALLASHVQQLSPPQRRALASELVAAGTVSQRRAHEITGVSRDTIRNAGRPAVVRKKRD
jgi:SpoVK/Ycf46/Vps4 family AAA+-type ATPase